jgi:predicted alpha/beta-hydrolase family hydrolase
MNHKAIYALYPQVITIDDGTGAFDKDGNKIEINQAIVDAKAIELQDIETAKEQAKETTKASALAKLTALGLTADEVKAILGTT